MILTAISARNPPPPPPPPPLEDEDEEEVGLTRSSTIFSFSFTTVFFNFAPPYGKQFTDNSGGNCFTEIS